MWVKQTEYIFMPMLNIWPSTLISWPYLSTHPTFPSMSSIQKPFCHPNIYPSTLKNYYFSEYLFRLSNVSNSWLSTYFSLLLFPDLLLYSAHLMILCSCFFFLVLVILLLLAILGKSQELGFRIGKELAFRIFHF